MRKCLIVVVALSLCSLPSFAGPANLPHKLLGVELGWDAATFESNCELVVERDERFFKGKQCYDSKQLRGHEVFLTVRWEDGKIASMQTQVESVKGAVIAELGRSLRDELVRTYGPPTTANSTSVAWRRGGRQLALFFHKIESTHLLLIALSEVDETPTF